MSVERLISAIRYQYPLGETTLGYCAHVDCTRIARGGRACVECLRAELAAIVGPVEAGAFVSATHAAHESAGRMLRRGKL